MPHDDDTANKDHPGHGVWKASDAYDDSPLGIYIGMFDDVVFHLAKHQNIVIDKMGERSLDDTGAKVGVHIGGKTREAARSLCAQFLAGRNARVGENSTYYEAIMLYRGATTEETNEYAQRIIREQALSKLTKEERRALGFA